MNKKDVEAFIKAKNELTTQYETDVKTLTEDFTAKVNESFPIKVGMIVVARVPKFKNDVVLHVTHHEITKNANINIVGNMIVNGAESNQVMTIGSYPITDDIKDLKKIYITANSLDEYLANNDKSGL